MSDQVEEKKEQVKIKCADSACTRDAKIVFVNISDNAQMAMCQYHLMSFCRMMLEGGQRKIAEILKGGN